MNMLKKKKKKEVNRGLSWSAEVAARADSSWLTLNGLEPSGVERHGVDQIVESKGRRCEMGSV